MHVVTLQWTQPFIINAHICNWCTNSGDTQTRKDSHSFLTEDTLRKYFSTILSPHNEPRRNRLDSWGVGSAAHTRLIHQQNPHNSAFFSPPLLCFCFLFCFFLTPWQKLGGPAAACSDLRVLEESGDAGDVQAEASRGASRSVNAGSEERVVLLPRAHTSRAR